MDDVRVRLLVADDEPLARRLVHRYARLVDGIDIVRECTNATELLTALMAEVFDAALIDIRMPGPDVFQILQEVVAVRTLPPLVFATAYDRYAVRAFEMNAVDYLVKPYTAERFARAIGKLHDRRGEAEGLSRLLRDLGPRPDRLLVPDGTRMVPVSLGEVDWVKAEGDYAHPLGRAQLPRLAHAQRARAAPRSVGVPADPPLRYRPAGQDSRGPARGQQPLPPDAHERREPDRQPRPGSGAEETHRLIGPPTFFLFPSSEPLYI